MSPELIDPQEFGFEKISQTKYSDCYAFGMVIYETIGGKLPFYKDTNHMVPVKMLKGERPSREAGFTDSLWGVLELCWAHQPRDRPSIEAVLQYLEGVSNVAESPSLGSDGGMEKDDNS